MTVPVHTEEKHLGEKNLSSYRSSIRSHFSLGAIFHGSGLNLDYCANPYTSHLWLQRYKWEAKE